VKVLVVGGGKMGLPLACQLADNGANVTIGDTNSEIVRKVNLGEPPFQEPQLLEHIIRGQRAGRLKATTDVTAAAGDADVAIMIVPALLTPERDIDYGNLISASEAVARGMKEGILVSYETTVPVGGCRSVLVPKLEKASEMQAGRDFHVSFSPERVKSQMVFERLRKTPKVVGGYDSASTEASVSFYSRYLGAEVIDVGSLEAAEFVKLAEMIYRDVNLALANELAAFSEVVGLDFDIVRKASNTSDESTILEPGVGVGGHCVPVYPYFLIRHGERCGVPQEFAALGRRKNESQPSRHVARIEAMLGSLKDSRVHILGLGFRPGVKEDAHSPAYDLKRALESAGAFVTLEDPLYSRDEIAARGFRPAVAGADEMDVVILNTAHSVFRKPDFSAWAARGVKLAFDGRSIWSRQTVESHGMRYLCVGKP